MKGFDELRYISPTLVIFIFLVTVLLMMLPYHIFQNEAISYTQEIYSGIFETSVENLASSLSVGYFQWHAMYHAVNSGDDVFIEEMLQEIQQDFPGVRSARLVDRPPEVPLKGQYKLYNIDQELYLYLNIYDSLMEREITDKVVIASIDKDALLSEMHLDERVSLTAGGSKSFAYGLRAEVKGYDLTKWLIFHSLASGIIGVLIMMEVLALGLSRYYEMSGLQEIMYLWEMEDSHTAFHSRNVAKIAECLGKSLGLKRKKVMELVNGAKLHDIGKMGISPSILRKHGPLDEIEKEVIRNHPQHGKEVLQHFKYLERFVPYAYLHHEREDGSGYPQGLNGDQLPLEAKIIAVSDVFEALTAERPYRDAYSFAQAVDMMTEMSLDQGIVSALIEILPELETELSGRNPEKCWERA
ncbi:diguanylate cyclase [Mesotoga sp. SC_NapDC]|nr:diguanylate cyclase [Mesotoga sp. SC_NapDC]